MPRSGGGGPHVVVGGAPPTSATFLQFLVTITSGTPYGSGASAVTF